MAPLCCLVNVIGRSCVVSSSSEMKVEKKCHFNNELTLSSAIPSCFRENSAK